jgi:hypothetical protein
LIIFNGVNLKKKLKTKSGQAKKTTKKLIAPIITIISENTYLPESLPIIYAQYTGYAGTGVHDSTLTAINTTSLNACE